MKKNKVKVFAGKREINIHKKKKHKKKKYSIKVSISGSRTYIKTIGVYADTTPKEAMEIVRKTLQKTRMKWGKIILDFTSNLAGHGTGRTPLD